MKKIKRNNPITTIITVLRRITIEAGVRPSIELCKVRNARKGVVEETYGKGKRYIRCVHKYSHSYKRSLEPIQSCKGKIRSNPSLIAYIRGEAHSDSAAAEFLSTLSSIVEYKTSNCEDGV